MNKWILLVAMGLATAPVLQAQQVVERQGFDKRLTSFKFDTNTHDFGEVPEEGGAVRYKFEFTNNGEVPIKVLDVKASCGCTTPDWSKDEIRPGEKGYIVAEYNPQNQPGQFHKTLTVSTNSEPNVSILNIKGVVKPKPRTAEEDFPAELGRLRMKYRGFNINRITTEKPAVRKFEVYNQGDKPLAFNKKNIEAPEHISVAFEPQTLPAKSRGYIVLTYDAAKRGELGWLTDNVVFYTNEPDGDNKKVMTVSATVEEYFPPMTQAELAQAPRLQLDRAKHEFGGVRQGNIAETEFTLSNTGQSVLNLRDIKSNCGCTVGVPEKKDLQPGESVKLKVSVNTEGRKGNQYQTVTIFSNDPTAPTQTLSLKVEVKE
jgi:hypothetical protein